jgi:acetate kinase
MTIMIGYVAREATAGILTINGGSSSIKSALFAATPELPRMLSGQITGIGLAKGPSS